MWQNWVNGVLGLWIILMPFLGFSQAALRTWMVVVGIVIAIFAFWAAMAEGKSAGGSTAGSAM